MKDEQILEEKNKREANELMLAKRRLESQRLLAELFRRVDVRKLIISCLMLCYNMIGLY